jgi:hypothetical protein
MEHIYLKPNDDYTNVDMTLYLGDVKILYNTCIDIINEHPEMIGYERTAKKLLMILEQHKK